MHWLISDLTISKVVLNLLLRTSGENYSVSQLKIAACCCCNDLLQNIFLKRSLVPARCGTFRKNPTQRSRLVGKHCTDDPIFSPYTGCPVNLRTSSFKYRTIFTNLISQ
jgi:hypothetical protein